MPAVYPNSQPTDGSVDLLILAFGINHPYRVVTLEEITRTLSQMSREAILEGLERLAKQDLVTKFGGRYCFNKAVPDGLRQAVGRFTTHPQVTC